MIIPRVRIQACLVFSVALVELENPADDGTFLGEFDSRAETSVRVRKGGFMVETL